MWSDDSQSTEIAAAMQTLNGLTKLPLSRLSLLALETMSKAAYAVVFAIVYEKTRRKNLPRRQGRLRLVANDRLLIAAGERSLRAKKAALRCKG